MPSDSSVLTQHRVVACPDFKRKVIDTDDDDQPRPAPRLWIIKIYRNPCQRCAKGKQDCVADEPGVACQACKDKKYRCDHTGDTEASMRVVQMRVAELESEGEVEVVTGGKGKQRAASVVVVKREKRTREEEQEGKKEKPKPRARTKPKVAPTRKKGKAKAKGSKPAELDEKGANQPMEINIGSDDELKPKQTRHLPGN
jgi:hypothetical protein